MGMSGSTSLQVLRACACAVALLSLASSVSAARVELSLRSTEDAGLADGVLAAYPLDAVIERPPRSASMAQQGQRFVPHLLVVQRGAAVDFPNRDRTRHHVYSFSEARSFELKLYLGEPAAPVRFDTAGIVTLGCNIHDWMLGYIVVVDTPFFAQSGPDGRLALDLPAGRYRLWAWHPRMPVSASALDETVIVDDSRTWTRTLTPELGPAPDLEAPEPLGLPAAGGL